MTGLFGCGNTGNSSQSNTRNGESFNIVNGYEIPVSLGESTISQEEIDKLDEVTAFQTVNNYADAFLYMLNKTYDNSAEAVTKAAELLYGDYEDLGKLTVNDYDLLILKTNDKYYPTDIFNKEDKTWMKQYELDQYSFESVDDLAKILNGSYQTLCKDGYKLGDAPYLVIDGKKIEETIKYNVPIYIYDGFEIPVALGYPKLSKDEIAQITESNAEAKITTYADALVYLYGNLHGKLKPCTVYDFAKEDQIVTGRFQSLYAPLLYGDYDQVYRLDTTSTDGTLFQLCLKGNDGRYYWLDWYEQVIRDNKGWLVDCFGEDYRGECYAFDSIEDVEVAMKDPDYNPGLRLDHIRDYPMTMLKPFLLADESFKKMENMILPDGTEAKTSIEFGVPCYTYCGANIPIDLGLPELTYEQIDELIKNKDYERTRQTIKTYADLACYCLRARFISIAGHAELTNGVVVDNNPKNPDVGNIKLDDDWSTTISGKQMLMTKFGQCSSASTFVNYMLADDYDELGYVFIRYKNEDGHVQVYFKVDDKYVMVNPVDQIFCEPNSDYSSLDDDSIAVSWVGDSLEKMMDSFINYKGPGANDEDIESCYTILSDFDLIQKRVNNHNYIFPTGTEVKSWTEASEFGYDEPPFDYKSRDRMFDISIPDSLTILKDNIAQ